MAGSKKFKGVFGIVSSLTAGFSAARGLSTARADKDKLLLVNAVGSIIVAATGLLIAVRAFRKGDK
ncbi:hypothetical protein V5P93_001693 [Actinokineospora auranticolor]|uniref:Uncharacterized protein n=1 Tax=Actinokineospora auranticolor TaxID=155976 RepID=A0A2S6GGM7_9PSEU|nr:hypothetical protein [Actinokineospora auranticolor]PPK64296.1 hypothetical protein CLV40_12017 [Actinokineospora auranticolor]